MLDTAYKRPLEDPSNRLSIEWLVIGPANLALQGVSVTPSRLGILIHHHDFQVFLGTYKDVPSFEIITLENGEAQKITIALHDKQVLVCAEHNHGIYWRVNHKPQMKAFDEILIPCLSLSSEKEAYRALGRDDRVALIDDFLVTNSH